MKIVFLLTRRVPDVPSPVILSVSEQLRAHGHEVEGWIPEDRLLRADTPAPDGDVYILKSHTELALSYAGALHLRGVPVINDYRSCLLAQDKVTASQVLRSNRVPTPDTWLVHDPVLAAPLLQDGPLIIKPTRGHRGAGVHLVTRHEELAELSLPGGPIIAQRYVPGPGHDLKVYVAGERVFAVRKTFDELSFTRPGEPVPVSDAVRDIAAKVRRGFGLELFGVDVIESADGPVVVDVNYFPGYKGCLDPAPAITDTLLDALPGALATAVPESASLIP